MIKNLYAEMANVAYQSKNNIKFWLLKQGFENVAFLDRDEVQGYVARKGNSLYVVFRGSENKSQDWIRNFTIELFDTETYGKVHKGFYSGVIGVLGPIIDRTRSRDKIVCIGHSQGGGLAVVCSAILKSYNYSVECVDFGTPRVGDTSFKKKFDKLNIPRTRFVNCSDVVTKIPLISMKYRHTGDLIFQDIKGKLHKNPSIVTIIYNIVTDVSRKGLKEVTEDHGITEYLKVYQKYLKEEV